MQNSTYIPVQYAQSTQAYSPAQPMQPQAYVPIQPTAPVKPAQFKPLSKDQLIFTLTNSAIADVKRTGVKPDYQVIKAQYKAFYSTMPIEQVYASAMAYVTIYDEAISQWRPVQNEQELRARQRAFSRQFFYWKNKRNAA